MEKSETVSSSTIEELLTKNIELEKQNEALQAKLKWLEELFLLDQQKEFGAFSEKTNPDQLELPLFNEFEITTDEKEEEPTIETITYRRKNVWVDEKRCLKTCLRKRFIIIFRKKNWCVCVVVNICMK